MSEAAAPAILVVDDESSALRGARRALRAEGFEHVLTLDDPREVVTMLEGQRVALLLLDLLMPHVSGEEILEVVSDRWPELPVVVMTAETDVRTAVRCMKLGAVDYLLKPVAPEQLAETVSRALEQSALRWENARLRDQFFDEKLEHPEAFASILTRDPAMLRVFAYLEAISRGSHPVLVTGETGSGKELVAQALHAVGDRDGPFVAVNVAGLDDAMFSDTLFGHLPGAFTGASGTRKGMIEQAGSGTLFLDEIGDLAEASQVKLLRLLQEGEYHPLGSDEPSRLRARVVAATHRDPSGFRQDLYYRLRAYHVRVPPLRERLGDLPLLVQHFLGLAADDLGKPRPTVPPDRVRATGRIAVATASRWTAARAEPPMTPASGRCSPPGFGAASTRAIVASSRSRAQARASSSARASSQSRLRQASWAWRSSSAAMRSRIDRTASSRTAAAAAMASATPRVSPTQASTIRPRTAADHDGSQAAPSRSRRSGPMASPA